MAAWPSGRRCDDHRSNSTAAVSKTDARGTHGSPLIRVLTGAQLAHK
jgi:hypothetical protein